jgi:transposase
VNQKKRIWKSIKKNHPKYRERARGIILSYRGYSPKEIAEIFEISDRMVYNWIDNFNENGITELSTEPDTIVFPSGEKATALT